MRITAILNEKSDFGKITLSTNIAYKLYLDNEKVLLGDSDPQGSARDWRSSGDNGIYVIAMNRPIYR